MCISTGSGPGWQAPLGAPQPGKLCIQDGDVSGSGLDGEFRFRDRIDGWGEGAQPSGAAISSSGSTASGSELPLLFGSVMECVEPVSHGSFLAHHSSLTSYPQAS